MSAFMCSDKHFQYIADGLYTYAQSIGNELNDKEYVQDLVNSFQVINIKALRERYKKPESMYSFSNRVAKPSLSDYIDRYQLLKALKCLKYQCSEGDIPETEEYKSLSNYIDIITDNIISESDKYQRAEWEIN